MVFEAADHEHIQIGGYVGLAYASGLLESHVFGDGDKMVSIGDCVLRVSTAADERHYSIARLPTAYTGADILDHAGDLEAEYL